MDDISRKVNEKEQRLELQNCVAWEMVYDNGIH